MFGLLDLASIVGQLKYTRDTWFWLLSNPGGLAAHVVLFLIVGYVGRRIFHSNFDRYSINLARADATGGLALAMYIALFIGCFDFPALWKLLESGVAQLELLVVIILGFLQEWLNFKDRMKGLA